MTTSELLKKFSPFVYLHPDEEYFPCSVDWYCQRVKLTDGQGKTLRDPVGKSADLYSPSQVKSYHLVINNEATRTGLPPQGDSVVAPVYGAVRDRGTSVLDVMYWFFYAFNGNIADLVKIRAGLATAAAGGALLGWIPGALPAAAAAAAALVYFSKIDGSSMHEGDWEHVTVRVAKDTYQMLDVYFAQHSDGQLLAQPADSSQQGYALLPGTTRPIVYSARSSHASYSKAGETVRLAGLANDYTGEGKTWDTSRWMVDISKLPAGSWLDYPGRWGKPGEEELIEAGLYVAGLGDEVAGVKVWDAVKKVGLADLVEYTNGPEGPKQKGSWIRGDDLPPTSGSIFSDLAGWNKPEYYTTIQFADVDGCGHPEVFGRAIDGIKFFTYVQDQGWSLHSSLSGLSDAEGGNKYPYYLSIRGADIDGDGQAEIVGRSSTRLEVYKWIAEVKQWAFYTGQGIFTDSADGWDSATQWSTIQWADLDRDGRVEALGRGPDGIRVYKFHKETRLFEQIALLPDFSDDTGWVDPSWYRTIQCADIDGCGAKEILGRNAEGVQVYKFSDGAFKHHSTIGFFGDANGFREDPRYYLTIKSGYLKGPGAASVIGRSPSGLVVYGYTAEKGWVEEALVGWMSDAMGWNQPEYYSTIQCADVDDDGREELIARGAGGVVISKFDWTVRPLSLKTWDGPPWSDANGWNDEMYYSTIQCAALGGTSFTRKSIFGRSPTGMDSYHFQG